MPDFTAITVDRQLTGITRREWTEQGYLRVPGRVARTGIQQYLARELKLEDRDPNELVNVYRPPEEVFAPESMESYDNVDVTVDHPSDMVDPETYKQVSVGHVDGAARQEGDHLVADMIIKDKSAIDGVMTGKTALSAGYKAEYFREPGATEDGTPYELVQRNIRINHVALVDRARAGESATLFDHNATGKRGETMHVVTLDGGKTVKLEDEATAQLIQNAMDAANKSYKDMEAKAKEHEDEAKKLRDEMEKMEAEKDKAVEERDEAHKQTSDAAIAERLAAVQGVRDSATKLAGETFSCDSVNPLEIQRAALKVVRPTVDWDAKGETYVQAAWDAEMERTPAERESFDADRSHKGLGDDLAKHYTGDSGQMVGDASYQQFLSGGKH